MLNRIVALSDTHGLHERIEVPECDILIHAGDACMGGSKAELNVFLNWLGKQQAKYKVFVPGNHDIYCESNPKDARIMCEDRGISMLIDEALDLEGIKIWGSPITPFFRDWAFNRHVWDIRKHWDLIPKGLDILITHGPPYQMLDHNMQNEQCGSLELFSKIMQVKPKVHIFGHIHGNNGIKEFNGTKFYNVCVLDERYTITDKVSKIDL